MVTTIIIEGKKHRFITQQYEVGLYVADYTEGSSIPDQFGIDTPEIDFHRHIREVAEISNDEIILEESTELDKAVEV